MDAKPHSTWWSSRLYAWFALFSLLSVFAFTRGDWSYLSFLAFLSFLGFLRAAPPATDVDAPASRGAVS